MIHNYIVAKEEMEALMESCTRQCVKVEPSDFPPVLDHSLRVLYTEKSLCDDI